MNTKQIIAVSAASLLIAWGAPASAETIVLDRTGVIELARFGAGQRNGPMAPWVGHVRSELASILCGTSSPAACRAVDEDDRFVVSTLDVRMQRLAERYLHEAVYRDRGDLAIDNGALAALDYQTGDVLAWVGNARFAEPASSETRSTFDILAHGWRQPASAFKPFAYLAGLETGVLTAATVFDDVSTEFEPGFKPRNADRKEHGRVRLREALRRSFNIPAVAASLRTGLDAIAKVAARFGLVPAPGAPTPGMAAALGVTERHPVDVLSAYGALANHGVLMRRRFILRIADQHTGLAQAREPQGRRVCSEAGAFLMTDLLVSEQLPTGHDHVAWAVRARSGVRPVAMKTGTSNDARDLNAYGYLAPPANPGLPALAVGVWLGNADGSPVGDTKAMSTAVPLWRAYVSAVSRDWPIAPFGPPPEGVVRVTIDAATGARPDANTRETMEEWFLRGTEPPEHFGVAASPPRPLVKPVGAAN